MRKVRGWFWLEAFVAWSCGVLAVMTAFWPAWIEALTGFDPDHHSGSVEWAIVALLLTLCVAVGAAARAEWRRPNMARS